MSNTEQIPLFRNIQFFIEYISLKFIFSIIRIFPLDISANISAYFWRHLAPFINKKRHRRALDNIKIAFPEKTDAERLNICLEHWENLGRVMAETVQIDKLIKDQDRITIKPDHVFRRYKDKMGPAIGVSLHMGNWELAIWPFVIANANPAAVYRSINNPYVDKYLRYLRKDLYPGGLFGRGGVEGNHGESQKTARILTDFVRHGGRLGLVCDLYDRSGIPIPFFGHLAKTQAIGAIIARRLGCRMWMSTCHRIGKKSHFIVEILELRVPRTENISDDIRSTMISMQKQFEIWIRQNPEQWMWSNRRWS
ncbi:MAG: lysophospholipid acyltransferase family protein [Hyphomicrobium sp.]